MVVSGPLGGERMQLRECFVVLRSVRPLLGCDEIGQRDDLDSDAVDTTAVSVTNEVDITLAPTVAAWDVRENVQVSGIGPPRRDLHSAQRLGVELCRQ